MCGNLSVVLFLSEPDVKVLPASGLDYIEIQTLRAEGEKIVGGGDEDNPEETEETEDYEDEEKPRKVFVQVFTTF